MIELLVWLDAVYQCVRVCVRFVAHWVQKTFCRILHKESMGLAYWIVLHAKDPMPVCDLSVTICQPNVILFL